MTVLAYFSYRPNFPGLNEAIYDAFANGNWSGFNYTAFASAFATGATNPSPTSCLDTCKSAQLSYQIIKLIYVMFGNSRRAEHN